MDLEYMPEWIAEAEEDDKSIIIKTYKKTIEFLDAQYNSNIGTQLTPFENYYIYSVGGCDQSINLSKLMMVCSDISSTGKVTPLLSTSGNSKRDLCFKITKSDKVVFASPLSLTKDQYDERVKTYKNLLIKPKDIKGYDSIGKLYPELKQPIYIILRNIQLFNINDSIDIKPVLISTTSSELNLNVTGFTGMTDLRFMESLIEKTDVLNRIIINPKSMSISFILAKSKKSNDTMSKKTISSRFKKQKKIKPFYKGNNNKIAKKRKDPKVKLGKNYYRVKKAVEPTNKNPYYNFDIN